MDITLPVGVQLNGRCGYVILDGSDFEGRDFKMSVTARLSYELRREAMGSLLVIGDEFILGANNHSNAFRITHIPHDEKVVAVFGSIAAMTMLGSPYPVPSGDWSATHRILVYHGGCAMFPNQFQDTEIPGLDVSIQNRPVIYEATVSGFGNQS